MRRGKLCAWNGALAAEPDAVLWSFTLELVALGGVTWSVVVRRHGAMIAAGLYVHRLDASQPRLARVAGDIDDGDPGDGERWQALADRVCDVVSGLYKSGRA